MPVRATLPTAPALRSNCKSFAAAAPVRAALRRPTRAGCAEDEEDCYTCSLAPPSLMDVAEGGVAPIRYQSCNSSKASGYSGSHRCDVIVMPLAATSANAWLASSPSAAAARLVCMERAALLSNLSESVEKADPHRRSMATSIDCSGLQRTDIANELAVTSAAPLLWDHADTPNASAFEDVGWRITRFITSPVGVERVRVAQALARQPTASPMVLLPDAARTEVPGARTVQQFKAVSGLASPAVARSVVNAFKGKGLISITAPAAPRFLASFPTSSTHTAIPDPESVLTLSRLLPEGNASSATSRAPNTVIGGEVSRAALWKALYRDANSGMCSKKGTASSVRCYLVNQGGAVLLSPEQSSATCSPRGVRDGCWATATWPQALQFLADLEPASVDALITLGAMERLTYDIPSQGAPTAATGYSISADKLPMGPVPLIGSVKADLYVRQVPGTDAYLVVLANYRAAASMASPRESCGVLSITCGSFVFPGIFQSETMSQAIWGAGSPRRVVLSLPEDANQRFMFQIRRDSYCSVPSPWWVTLLGWCVTGIVLAGLAIIATYKKRIRELKSMERGEIDENDKSKDWQARTHASGKEAPASPWRPRLACSHLMSTHTHSARTHTHTTQHIYLYMATLRTESGICVCRCTGEHCQTIPVPPRPGERLSPGHQGLCCRPPAPHVADDAACPRHARHDLHCLRAGLSQVSFPTLPPSLFPSHRSLPLCPPCPLTPLLSHTET